MAEVERLCERVIIMKQRHASRTTTRRRGCSRATAASNLEEVFLDVARGRGEAREAAQ